MGNLTDLREGERGIVARVGGSAAMRGRLFDLGLTEGSTVACEHRKRRGDIAAYSVRGAVIALRYEDAAAIELERGGGR
ncbi:MAG: ferrous iron transport protein A [Oscillospiraceae bacterium]|jgi:ferrous iron transport protein A|nr:ferrous iron transport protein A [Oscillospiraceae bacterium]